MSKVKIGVVVCAKLNKTLRVRVARMICHPVYRKVVKRYKCYMVHDGANEYKGKEGCLVKISGCRPVSATKKWIVVNA